MPRVDFRSMPQTPPRIDCHVHVFPERLAQAVRNALQRDNVLQAGFLAHEVAQQVTDAGFDRAWALPYAHREGVAEGVNEWSASELAQFPSLVPGATFHPADAEFARIVERALVELRLRVVKLHCSVGQYTADDPRLEPLWRLASQEGVPIVIHAGRRGPGIAETDEIDALAPVLEAHPDLRLVLAHSGFPQVARALELMERYPNLYADFTPVWTNPIEVAAETIQRMPGRFLFGSDVPNCPMPVADLVARVEEMPLSREDRDSVLGGAAAALSA